MAIFSLLMFMRQESVKDSKGGWLDELPSILCYLRTTLYLGIGEAPCNLMFGTEVVILTEIDLNTHQVVYYAKQANETKHRENLDFLDEVRDQASFNYKSRVHSRQYSVRDIVMRNVEASQLTSQREKLSIT